LDLKGLRIVVTGGSGFFGSHLVERLVREEAVVTVFDKFARIGRSVGLERNLAAVLDKIKIVKGDILKTDQVLEALKDANVVTHLAAIVDYPTCNENPELAFNVNCNGTLNLLNCSRKSESIERVIVASSGGVYGWSTSISNEDKSPLRPANIYRASKACADYLAQAYWKQYRLPTVVIRPGAVFGQRRLPYYPPSFSDFSTLILNSIKNDTVIIEGGKQRRDWFHVENLIFGLILALTRKEAIGDVFNIGTGVALTWEEMVRMVVHEANSKSEIIYRPYPPNLNEDSVDILDITKAQQKLGYRQVKTFQQGLRETIKWFRENQDFIESLLP
jgi:nucleoside-diphosphate-sugar epimerase